MTDSTLSFGVDIPFVKLLGFQLTLFEGGRSEVLLPADPEHLNSFAVTHGGVLMALLDVTMASAARSVCPELGVVTIEMKTSFMRPAIPSENGPLVAKGELMHRTATMAFVEATVHDEAGRACAHSTGTFKYVRRLPTGAKSANGLDVISTD